jgi:hypothetical protein
VIRAHRDSSAIFASQPHKGVLSGTSIESTAAKGFVGTGEALKPFSVVGVSSVREDSGDITITFIRRGRLGQELRDGVDIPLSEETESYECEIYDTDGETLLRTLTSTSQSFTYESAQVASDFGSPVPDSITVYIYQRSAVVGRGHATEATI